MSASDAESPSTTARLGESIAETRPPLTIDLTTEDLRPSLAPVRPLATRLAETPDRPGLGSGAASTSGSTTRRRVVGPAVHPLVPGVVELAAFGATATTIGMLWRAVGSEGLVPVLAVLGLLAAPAWWIVPWGRASRRGIVRTEIAGLIATVGVAGVFYAVARDVIPAATHRTTALVLAIVGGRAVGLLAAGALSRARSVAGRANALVLAAGRLAGPALGLAAVSAARSRRDEWTTDQLLVVILAAEAAAALALVLWLLVDARWRRPPVLVPAEPDDEGAPRHRPPYWSSDGTLV